MVRNQIRPRMAIVDNVLYGVFKTAEYLADEQRVLLGSLSAEPVTLVDGVAALDTEIRETVDQRPAGPRSS